MRTKDYNKRQVKKHGLNDPFFGRGELQDYTGQPLGMLKGKGEVIDCPTCGKRGIERKWKRGGGHVIHSDQMVSMMGIICCEIIASCGVKKDVWPAAPPPSDLNHGTEKR